MNSIHFRLFVFLILFSGNALSQEKDSSATNHIIALQFGVNQIKDKNLHPKVSTGTITELHYGFEKRKNNWQQFNFALGYSRLKTELEDLSKSFNLKINFDYSYSFSLIHKTNFRYYLGPEMRIAYSASFFPNWDDSHLYWADNFSIGAKNIFAFRCKNQNEWITTISLPLFSVFSRPELYRLYKIDDTDAVGIIHNLNSNITAAHLTNVFFLDFQTEYRFPVFKNKQQSFYYSMEWLKVKHDDGNSFNQLSHQIGIKLFL